MNTFLCLISKVILENNIEKSNNDNNILEKLLKN